MSIVIKINFFRAKKIVEIDATDSALMEAGFPYLHQLTDLTRIKFKNCRFSKHNQSIFSCNWVFY